MKSYIKLLSLAAFTLLISASSLSAQKIAHVDVNSIIDAMPQVKVAKSKIEALGLQLSKQIEKKQAELQQKYTAAATKEQNGELTPKQVQETAATLQKLQEEIQSDQLKAQQDLAAKEAELTEPILQSVKDKIEEVAKEKGFDYVTDKNNFIYAGGTDLTATVKSRLGL